MNKKLVTLDILPYHSQLHGGPWSCDGLWHNAASDQHEPFFYLCARNCLEQAGFSLSVERFEQIDKSKPWFINLGVLLHNWDAHRSIFDILPQDLLQELISGKAYLIINNENEYWTETILKPLYHQCQINPIVPIDKIFLLSGASMISEVNERYVKDNNLPFKIKVLYSPHMNVLNLEGYLDFLLRPDKTVKSKRFNTLNREWRLHRPAYVAMLAGLGLIDHAHLSLGAQSDFIRQINQSEGWYHYLNRIFVEQKELYNRPKNCKVFDLIFNGIEQIHDKIPICLDVEEFDTNYAKWEYTPVDYMKDSYFHVCSSTFFFQWQEQSPGWHEKEWKPILIKQPHIIKGRPHMLKLLRSFGFLTFGKWIDESYDGIEDDWDRLYAIAKETERLCNLYDNELDYIILDMKNTLDYNYEVLVNKKWDLFFYGGDLKNLVSYL